MIRVIGNAMRHPRDATPVRAALSVVAPKRPANPRPHQRRPKQRHGLTRQNGQATPPNTTPGNVAQSTGFAPTLPDHRSEVRFDGLAARVMGAS